MCALFYVFMLQLVLCVLSEEMWFETFTPIWSLVNENENKKLAKIEISQFFEQFW